MPRKTEILFGGWFWWAGIIKENRLNQIYYKTWYSKIYNYPSDTGNLFLLSKGTSLAWSKRNRAFWWKSLGKPFGIPAVVVDHVILLDPLELLGPSRVQSLVPPPGLGGWAGWLSGHPYTCICTKIPVGCDKWWIGPVDLDEAPACGPVISVPEARIKAHGLIFWVWDP